MRAYIIKGFLPWMLFFAFANGTTTGLGLGGMLGMACLLSINFESLKRRFILDWAALVFFLAILFAVFGFRLYGIATYDVLLADAILFLVCFFSLLFRNPVTQQYAKVRVSEIYWENRIFLSTNFWITMMWGGVFLCASMSSALFSFYHTGSQLWMMQIIPVVCIVIGIAFTILFPDSYKAYKIKKCGMSYIASISDVEQASLGEISIGYRLLGEGPLLVLANDAYMTMHMWDPDFIKGLSQFFTVLIFDYPGVGYSSCKEMPINSKTLSASLSRLLEKLELKPKVILGYGMGGRIAQQFVVDQDDQTISLILINSDMSGEKAKKEIENIMQELSRAMRKSLLDAFSLFFPEEAPDSVIGKFEEVSSSARLLDGVIPKEMIEKQTALMKEWHDDGEVAQSLIRLKPPILLFFGQHDIIIPPENSRLLLDAIPEASCFQYENAGHGVIYQYPYDIIDHIKEFLKV